MLTLVADGRATATIVTAEKPSANARAASVELQNYVEKISGAKLAIVTDAAPVSGTVVLVGRSRLTDKLSDLRIPYGRSKNLREEGFVIRTRSDCLVLAGNDAEPYLGTRYAVVELLHRMGVRWFMPGVGQRGLRRAHALQDGVVSPSGPRPRSDPSPEVGHKESCGCPCPVQHRCVGCNGHLRTYVPLCEERAGAAGEMIARLRTDSADHHGASNGCTDFTTGVAIGETRLRHSDRVPLAKAVRQCAPPLHPGDTTDVRIRAVRDAECRPEQIHTYTCAWQPACIERDSLYPCKPRTGANLRSTIAGSASWILAKPGNRLNSLVLQR
jgi:hypothetical protein